MYIYIYFSTHRMEKKEPLSITIRPAERNDETSLREMGQAIYRELRKSFVFHAFTQPTTLGYTSLLAIVFYVVFASRQAAIFAPILVMLYMYISIRNFSSNMISSCVDLHQMYDFWVNSENKRKNLWVAADDKNVVLGMIAMRECKSDVAEISRLYVKPTARRRGIGKRLVQKAVSSAKVEGFINVYLEVSNMQMPAINLFESVRFGQLEVKKTYMLLPGVFHENSIYAA